LGDDSETNRALGYFPFAFSPSSTRRLDIASHQLMRAEASTLAGLTALLRHVAPLLQEAGAPGLPD
jgi:hypothetical protein